MTLALPLQKPYVFDIIKTSFLMATAAVVANWENLVTNENPYPLTTYPKAPVKILINSPTRSCNG